MGTYKEMLSAEAASSASTGVSGGHECVDLGLSVKWATCNVGASSPEVYGDYYAWGETSTKSSYDEDNCATHGKEIGDIAGTSRDVARAKWGGSWRMPTEAECEELIDNCTWTWTTRNGVSGCKVTGPNGNSIFLPAAGCRDGMLLDHAGEWGIYWSSTPDGDDIRYSYHLSFYGGDHDMHWGSRYGGLTVRPVTEEKMGTYKEMLSAEAAPSASTGISGGHEYVDLGLSVKWATCNIGASSPEGYGYYYAWGETSTKLSYDEDNCVTHGKEIGDIAGTSRDVARAKWGRSWRMPTEAECKELIDNCTWTWTTRNGVSGCKVTGPNGNSIFLPAAGFGRFGTSLDHAGEWGIYWSSTPDGDDIRYSYGLYFISGHYGTTWMIYRYYGRTVRPVTEEKMGTYKEMLSAEAASSASTGTSGGHEYVDLGLSVKWATCNIGANSPEGYGDYYAWGETSTKLSYDEDNCATFGKEIGDIAGTSRDVARAKWGRSWRMPTEAECKELIDNCTWTWTTRNGVSGCKVTGPNGNSIFLPAAGSRNGTSLYRQEEDGYYWSSSPFESYTQSASILGFYSSYHSTGWLYRSLGRTVRPVTE